MGPVQIAKKTDGTGNNSNKDRWGRSKLQKRQTGPVQTAGKTVRAGSVTRRTDRTRRLVLSVLRAGREDESAGKASSNLFGEGMSREIFIWMEVYTPLT